MCERINIYKKTKIKERKFKWNCGPTLFGIICHDLRLPCFWFNELDVFSYKSLLCINGLLVYKLAFPIDDGHGDDTGDGVKHPESYDVGINFNRFPGQIPY